MRRKRKLIQTVVICLIVLFGAAIVQGGSLQEDFDKLCVHTQDAESLSLERLQELVTECDRLKERIEESNDPKKKLLLFRLNKCRNFLAYMLELRKADSSDSPQ